MNQILFDCERTKHQHTGLFHFCLQLGNALIRNADAGSEKLTFYVPRARRRLFGPNQQYYFHRDFHKWWIPRNKFFNVWHCTYQSSALLPPPGSSRVVLTIHDLNFLVEKKASPAKLKKYLARVQSNIDRADHVVCISKATLDTVSAHLRLDSHSAEVIHNGCNVNDFPSFDHPAYRPNHPYLFSLGTVLPKKNFHVLPALLVGNDYELLIAGILNPEYEKVVRAAAQSHGVESRVHLLGPVSEEEKSWYFRNCHAFAFPSLAEGFGLPVVEAMYYGKPVFLSQHPALQEIGGNAAYYFHDFDAQSMRNVFERGMMDFEAAGKSDQVRQQASLFSWDRAALEYLRVYRQLEPRQVSS